MKKILIISVLIISLILIALFATPLIEKFKSCPKGYYKVCEPVVGTKKILVIFTTDISNCICSPDGPPVNMPGL
jgi:hypothetical protein